MDFYEWAGVRDAKPIESYQYSGIPKHFVPLSYLSYDRSVLGLANQRTGEIFIAQELDEVTKDIVELHERNHIIHPEWSERENRFQTWKQLEKSGDPEKTSIAKRMYTSFVHAIRYKY